MSAHAGHIQIKADQIIRLGLSQGLFQHLERLFTIFCLINSSVSLDRYRQ
jgi:hypothetical protein